MRATVILLLFASALQFSAAKKEVKEMPYVLAPGVRVNIAQPVGEPPFGPTPELHKASFGGFLDALCQELASAGNNIQLLVSVRIHPTGRVLAAGAGVVTIGDEELGQRLGDALAESVRTWRFKRHSLSEPLEDLIMLDIVPGDACQE